MNVDNELEKFRTIIEELANTFSETTGIKIEEIKVSGYYIERVKYIKIFTPGDPK